MLTFFSAAQKASAVEGAAEPATLAVLLARDMLAPLAVLSERSSSAPDAGSRRGACRSWPSIRSAAYICGGWAQAGV